MCFRCRNRVQIFDIIIFPDSQLHVIEDIFIFLLKHNSILTIRWLTRIIIFAIICYLINKEQGQHFYTLIE